MKAEAYNSRETECGRACTLAGKANRPSCPRRRCKDPREVSLTAQGSVTSHGPDISCPSIEDDELPSAVRVQFQDKAITLIVIDNVQKRTSSWHPVDHPVEYVELSPE